MATTPMTLDDLRRMLTEAAGEPEHGALAGDIADTGFEALGYDSLALLETAALITQEFGVRIADEDLFELRTPRAVLDLVNGAAAQAR
ncbi:acyl carrier protein [Streptomyces sp. NPDC048595]|uniref:acyl carrier protein n=1 Tax=Streptomyces sp. NPDC048595 TaxID=3365576 RepID=UPI003719D5B2